MRVCIAIALAALTLASPARGAEPVVAYPITDAAEIAESLTGEEGDAAAGQALFSEPRAGCAGCHGKPGGAGIRSASDLDGIGRRLSAGAIRLWIVAPEVQAPQTVMPAYYAAGQRSGAEDPLYGGPALTAAEVEDLVAYLSGLTAPE
jgi:sulfur-oxidizing protein SoxX